MFARLDPLFRQRLLVRCKSTNGIPIRGVLLKGYFKCTKSMYVTSLNRNSGNIVLFLRQFVFFKPVVINNNLLLYLDGAPFFRVDFFVHFFKDAN